MTTQTAPSKWVWPIDVTRYERKSELSTMERLALADWVKKLKSFQKFPSESDPILQRLFQPVRDVLEWFDPDIKPCSKALVCRNKPQRHIAYAMHEWQQTYWGWGDNSWLVFLKTGINQLQVHEANHDFMVVAYLLGEFSDFRRVISYQPERFALKLFGPEHIQSAHALIVERLKMWGYGDSTLGRMVARTLCTLLIENRSPYLHDLTEEVVQRVYDSVAPESQPWILRISRVLNHLDILSQSLKLDFIHFKWRSIKYPRGHAIRRWK